MTTNKVKQAIIIDGERWALFSDIVYTYEQAIDKSRSWAITEGSGIETKIISYEEGYLLYYR